MANQHTKRYSVDVSQLKDTEREVKRLRKLQGRLVEALRAAADQLQRWGPEDEPDHVDEDGTVHPGRKAENPVLGLVLAALKAAKEG